MTENFKPYVLTEMDAKAGTIKETLMIYTPYGDVAASELPSYPQTIEPDALSEEAERIMRERFEQEAKATR